MNERVEQQKKEEEKEEKQIGKNVKLCYKNQTPRNYRDKRFECLAHQSGSFFSGESSKQCACDGLDRVRILKLFTRCFAFVAQPIFFCVCFHPN